MDLVVNRVVLIRVKQKYHSAYEKIYLDKK